ncbi:MAG TPA: hypothetical protein VFB77_09620 [Acidimicrobiales bacterium]|nr:hypothetical protein [Acidimicrobiales bacterium]
MTAADDPPATTATLPMRQAAFIGVGAMVALVMILVLSIAADVVWKRARTGSAPGAPAGPVQAE